MHRLGRCNSTRLAARSCHISSGTTVCMSVKANKNGQELYLSVAAKEKHEDQQQPHETYCHARTESSWQSVKQVTRSDYRAVQQLGMLLEHLESGSKYRAFTLHDACLGFCSSFQFLPAHRLRECTVRLCRSAGYSCGISVARPLTEPVRNETMPSLLALHMDL